MRSSLKYNKAERKIFNKFAYCNIEIKSDDELIVAFCRLNERKLYLHALIKIMCHELLMTLIDFSLMFVYLSAKKL